ncbi:MAG: response regulator [Elusimicrobiota bacterium]
MKKILIVDDEKDVLTYLDTLFADNGYQTIVADNADDALEKARRESPDLVSLDINMPGKSGVKLYRTLKDDEKLKSTPVIVVTAITGPGNNPEDYKRFLSTRKSIPPPDGFIPKPIDKDELIKMVKELIG